MDYLSDMIKVEWEINPECTNLGEVKLYNYPVGMTRDQIDENTPFLSELDHVAETAMIQPEIGVTVYEFVSLDNTESHDRIGEVLYFTYDYNYNV